MKSTFFTSIVIILYLILFACSSIHYFSNNFLLRRVRIEGENNNSWRKWFDNSLKNVSLKSNQMNTISKDSIIDVSNPKKSKVILFVIDALRFDFVERIETITKSIEKGEGILFKFCADPPTTTSQRLRSLLTGSLPVFIEQGESFNSDIILDQVFLSKNESVVLGDRAWADLLGSEGWLRMRTFPSFNVRDLDGVDDGILRYLYEEIQYSKSCDPSQNAQNEENYMFQNRESLRNHYTKLEKLEDDVVGSINGYGTWRLLVAHFLGVDHVGHRFGAHFPQMQVKLNKMSSELQKVMDEMDDNTILMVFGDHGMNDFGDHGGSTDIEVDSALFVYMKGKRGSTDPRKEVKIVSQLDFTSTVSWLLNRPIPFSNLGSIIPEVLQYILDEENSQEVIFKSLVSNLYEVVNYITKYVKVDTTFLSKTYQNQLMKKLEECINTSIHLQHSKNREMMQIESNHIKIFLEEFANICRLQWAQFNVMNMSFGLLGLLYVILLAGILWGGGFELEKLGIKSLAIIIISNISLIWFNILLQSDSSDIPPISILFLCSLISLVLIRTWRLNMVKSIVQWDKLSGFVFLSYLFLFLSVLSNSFIIYEDRIAAFLFFALYICFVVYMNQCRCTEKYDKGQIISSFIITFMIGICTISSRLMTRTRLHGIHSLEKSLLDNRIQLHYTVIFLVISNIVFFAYRSMNRYQHSSAWIIVHTIFDEIVLGSLSCLVWLYWRIDESYPKVFLWLPRVVLLLGILHLAWKCFQWKIIQETDNSFFSHIYQCLSTFVVLIKGFNFALIYCAMNLQVCLLLYSIQQATKVKNINRSRVLFLSITMWSLMSLQYYFAFGQQNTIDSIKWTAAFIGIQEFHAGIIQVISGILVIVGIYSSRILHCLCFVWIVRSNDNVEIDKTNNQESFGKTKVSSRMQVQPRRHRIRNHIYSNYLLYIIYLLLPATFSSICAYTHRRHLMMWTIFAPKFMFDSIGFIVSSICLFLGYFLSYKME